MVKFDLNYLSGNCLSFHLVMKVTAEVGLCALYVFKNVYKERFSLIGVDEKLDALKSRLRILTMKPESP